MQTIRYLVPLTFLFFWIILGVATAQDFQARDQMAYQENQVIENGYLGSMNEACETDITASFNWDSFTIDDDFYEYSAAAPCNEALSAIQYVICDSDVGKQIVSEQIKAIECRYGTMEDSAITDDGVFKVQFEWGDPNLYDRYIEFLQDNL
jgi:hypothetical protein